MNYAAARQLANSGGRWHYTIRNGYEIWRHACCQECEFAARGHATREDAYKCAHDYALKKAGEWKEWSFGAWRDCVVCGMPTKKGAKWDGVAPGWPEIHGFCDAHLNDEGVLAQVEPPGHMHFS